MSNQAKTYLKHFAMGALIAALGAGSYVIADVVFSDFTTGSTISSSEMNAKLNALRDAVNANSVACPANTPTRFTDNGDGTICDRQTGLMWEKKTGTPGGALVTCATPTDCPDAQHLTNTYTWSAASPFEDPTGTLYSNFLERLNDLKIPNDGTATSCFAGHCDWRIPTIGELRSILQAPYPDCTIPCIAAGFPGPTQATFYWSSSSGGNLAVAWEVNFYDGVVNFTGKSFDNLARAVRGGR